MIPRGIHLIGLRNTRVVWPERRRSEALEFFILTVRAGSVTAFKPKGPFPTWNDAGQKGQTHSRVLGRPLRMNPQLFLVLVTSRKRLLPFLCTRIDPEY